MSTIPKDPKDQNLNPTQQVRLAQQVTKQFGAELSEAQRIQILYWPWAVDPALPAIGWGEAHISSALNILRYLWRDPDKAPGFKPDQNYRKRLKELEKGVKVALGQAFRLEVYMNGDTPAHRIYPEHGRHRKVKEPGKNRRKSGKRNGRSSRRSRS